MLYCLHRCLQVAELHCGVANTGTGDRGQRRQVRGSPSRKIKDRGDWGGGWVGAIDICLDPVFTEKQ